MNDEHLEAEVERLDAQCQRMASEYCELAKAHSKLKSDYADLRFVCKQLGIYEKEIRSLKAEVERLTKAGDAMADEIVGCFNAEGYDPADSDALTNWYAAKEGKGQP
jgi:prefoldin subunit 5